MKVYKRVLLKKPLRFYLFTVYVPMSASSCEIPLLLMNQKLHYPPTFLDKNTYRKSNFKGKQAEWYLTNKKLKWQMFKYFNLTCLISINFLCWLRCKSFGFYIFILPKYRCTMKILNSIMYGRRRDNVQYYKNMTNVGYIKHEVCVYVKIPA